MVEHSEVEKKLEKTLIEGDLKQQDAHGAIRKMIVPKYEIIVRAENDPIAEETKLIRRVAKDPDDRYDKYK